MNLRPSPSETVATAAGSAPQDEVATRFELRFDSLFVEGRGLSFPCDAQGRVDEAALTPRARANYQRARSVVGREFRTPAVQRSDLH